MTDYKQKYLKYKQKYLYTKLLYSGGTLEDEQLKIISNIILTSTKDIALIEFNKYILKYLFTVELTREQRYDIHFLSTLMMLKHDHIEPIYLSSMLDKTQKYNVNSDIKC